MCCSTTKLVTRKTESWCLPSVPYYKEHKSGCAVHCFHGSKCSLLCWHIGMDAHFFHYNRIWFFLAHLTWMSNYCAYHIYFLLKGMKPHSLPHTCHKPRPTAIGKNHILFLCLYLLKWNEATTLQACCRWNEDSIGFFWVLANIRTESSFYWILEMEQELRMRFLWIFLYTYLHPPSGADEISEEDEALILTRSLSLHAFFCVFVSGGLAGNWHRLVSFKVWSLSFITPWGREHSIYIYIYIYIFKY